VYLQTEVTKMDLNKQGKKTLYLILSFMQSEFS